jgi:gamma-glutamylcyclotransferase (GGCT)/AIG2-like uncharacterized protein YtfP
MIYRLFVYGTLLSTSGHPMATRLQRNARLLGPATIQGRLYSLGRYPGLVQALDAPGLVHGELFALTMPAVTLRWLDGYEGVLPGKPEESPYERAVRPVQLVASGETVNAWVYLYRKSVRTRPEVKDGRWLSPKV